MNLPANFPLKKVIITVVSVVIVIALIITGVTVAVNGKAANATVDVEQVSNISTQYWGDQSSTYGNATSDFVQELYPDKEKAISKIFVKEGDTVKIGDTLLQYDTTKLQLTVESKELEEIRTGAGRKRTYEAPEYGSVCGAGHPGARAGANTHAGAGIAGGAVYGDHGALEAV